MSFVSTLKKLLWCVPTRIKTILVVRLYPKGTRFYQSLYVIDVVAHQFSHVQSHRIAFVLQIFLCMQETMSRVSYAFGPSQSD